MYTQGLSMRANTLCEPRFCIECADLWNRNGAKQRPGYKRYKSHGSPNVIDSGTKWNQAGTKRLALQKLGSREQGVFWERVEPSGPSKKQAPGITLIVVS